MLLSAETVNIFGETKLHIWPIGGGKPETVDPPFKPFFYSTMPIGAAIKVTKKSLSDMQRRMFYKCFFPTEKDMYDNRCVHSCEELSLLQRIVCERGFKIESPLPSVMSFDIETEVNKRSALFPSPRKEKIIAISTETQDGIESWAGDERDIIQNFIRSTNSKNPDIVTTKNGSGFDFPYVMQRCNILGIPFRIGRNNGNVYILKGRRKLGYTSTGGGKGKSVNLIRINGRQHFDLEFEIRMDSSLIGIKSHGLKTVGRYFFPEEKVVEVDYYEMSSLTHEELIEYCSSDAHLTYRLATEVYLPNLYALAEIFDAPLNMLIERYPSHIPRYIYGRDFTKLGIVADKINKDRFPEIFAGERKLFGGGLCELYQAGLFKPVKKLDFKSMYPSIMMCYNLSPESIKLISRTWPLGEMKFDGNIVEVPDAKLGQVKCEIDLDVASVTRKRFAEFMSRRAEIKKQMKKDPQNKRLYCQQWALKVCVNASYGYHGNRYARWGSVLVAILTTGIGRYFMKQAVDFLDKHPEVQLIEVDTDGVYYVGPDLSKECTEYLRTLVPPQFRGDYLSLDVDKYDAGIFYEEKNYVLQEGDHFIFHGSGLKGRHLPRICDNALEEVLNTYFAGENVDKAIWDYYSLEKFPYRLFTMTVELSKDPHDYAKTSMYSKLTYQFEKKGVKLGFGDEISFVKTVRGFRPAHLHAPNELLDYKYYKKRIADVLARVLESTLGYDSKSIYEMLNGQRRL